MRATYRCARDGGGLDEAASSAVGVALLPRAGVGDEKMGAVVVLANLRRHLLPALGVRRTRSHKLGACRVTAGGLIVKGSALFEGLGVGEPGRTNPILGRTERIRRAASWALLELTTFGFPVAARGCGVTDRAFEVEVALLPRLEAVVGHW